MTGVIERVVARVARGGPLQDALTNFHTHVADGQEYVYVCPVCLSPRVQPNDLDLTDEDTAPFTCLDCNGEYFHQDEFTKYLRVEFEEYLREQYGDEANV